MSNDDLKTHQRRFFMLKRKFAHGYSMLEGLDEFRARRKAALAEMELLLQEVTALGDNGHMLQKEIREFLTKHRQRVSVDLDAELQLEQASKGITKKDQNKKPDSSPSFIDWINAREHETHFTPASRDEDTSRRDPASLALRRSKH